MTVNVATLDMIQVGILLTNNTRLGIHFALSLGGGEPIADFFMIGDVNYDGILNDLDANAIFNLVELPNQYVAEADMNQDGVIELVLLI